MRIAAPTKPIDLARTADFSLGHAHIRPSARQVKAGDVLESLEPRVMQVLVLLAQSAGRTVSRDTMIERCWGGVIVGEDAVQRCIGRLRKVAETTGAFEIVTLSRVGYRLNAHAIDAGPAKPERLVAVLPFDNLSNDPSFDYFAEGVAEEILQSIARSSSIKVIGRTSSFQFRGPQKVVARIAQDLGATHILDGSVRRSGQQLGVAAHLMEVAEQTMLWADRFDGSTDAPFVLQDDVARKAVEALAGTFRDAVPNNAVAGAGFDALLKLRQILHRSSFGGDDEAVIVAVEKLTPDSAEAWAIIANVRAAQRWTTSSTSEPELRAAARAAAERALQLDVNCGAAHKALFLLEPPAGRFLAQESRLERALAANPEDSELLWSLYFHYLAVGRLKRSAQLAEEAYRVDPLQPRGVIAYANSLYTAGLPQQSLALMQHAVDRWPTDATVFAITVWTAAVEGKQEFARALLQANWRSRYAERSYPLIERAVHAAEGILTDPARLLQQTRTRMEQAVRAGQVEISLTGLLAFLGMDLDMLYDLVDRMPVEQLRAPGHVLGPLDGLSHLFLRVNSRLRTTARFVTLCERLGLVDYWRDSGQWPDCVDEVTPYYDFKAVAETSKE
jgi:TolB-like protein